MGERAQVIIFMHLGEGGMHVATKQHVQHKMPSAKAAVGGWSSGA